MDRYIKVAAIVVLMLAVLFVICGIAFNLVFRYISYSFYKNAERSAEADETIKKLEIGEDKDLIGYVRSTDYTKANKTIIYFGGSGEIAYNAVLKYGKVFKDYTLVSVDYPGSQESRGSMNLKTMQEAALKLYDYIAGLNYVDKDKIYVIGYSYGTGIATYLASQRDCAGLVLAAPYRDVHDLYNSVIPVFNSPFGWFITDNIDTKEYAKSVTAKTLIITSDSDTTIKSSIPYSLADYFSNAGVNEFTGIKHEGYWSDKDVVSTVTSFCK
ncbi:MAG: alpha/beta hydrolase family protein [Caulobacteraceae bacterium]